MSKVSGSFSAGASETMPKNLFGYEVIDFIGEGAGSTIFAVNQPESGQLYARVMWFERTTRTCVLSSNSKMNLK